MVKEKLGNFSPIPFLFTELSVLYFDTSVLVTFLFLFSGTPLLLQAGKDMPALPVSC